MVQIGDLLAQITGEPSPKTTNFPSLPKRKADDDTRRPTEKTQRIGSQVANSSKPIDQVRKPTTINTSKISQHGGRLITASSSTATFKNGHPTPPPSTDPPKPPKKGSYAEIMARAKAAQSTLGQVGKIQHKQIEKLPSRRERDAMKAKKGKSIQHGLAPNSKFQRSGQASATSGKDVRRNGKVAPEPEKKVKKAALATTGYAGTARPKAGGAASSKNGLGTSSRIERDRYQRDRLGSRYDRYLSEDEEDEELEGDVEEDYQSDVSSDMEAAAFEVDEEEELATRIARKEDAEALAEENRLKREKEEKKRRLMAMAKKASARR